ncbi:MAG: UDP-N-acetylglucosamine diphosphorylase/glucosamine-1-phosphate N-acetyltransferase [Proteobacteria bacterium]|nr:MAG: UDP-N-acetylglucosamine diphosphorylase/glucosamine-1-phosphate N-acetyltransferase [Pseudomonadota bacterium]
MQIGFSTIALAAGKGTRMKSPLPKVLHRACGRSLLGHVLHAAEAAGASHHYVIVGHGGEAVVNELKSLNIAATEVWQKEQKGTGHAVQMALPALRPADELFVIVNGDGPLLKADSLRAMVAAHRASGADLTLGVMELENPHGYGRVLNLAGGALSAIVEEKEATAEEKAVKLVNGGLYVVSRAYLAEFLPKLVPSAKAGELYLTDIVAAGAAAKRNLRTFAFKPEELMGVNDLEQLNEVERLLRKRLYGEWMRSGVRLDAPEALWADVTVNLEPGCRIGPNVVLQGNSRVATGVVVEAGCVIIDSQLEEGVELKAYSHLESAIVRKNAHVGPYARLRPKADIGEEARIGNFVEVKNTKMGKGAKANHLSYLGDAEVGEGTNIGCGFIACNYDGVNKNKTTIGKNAFVGSNVQAVAPVTIGDDAYVATGSVITRDVPVGALGIARVKQENKEGYAQRLRARMLAIKNGKGK